jgi:predicted Zn-dependent peptidase
MDKKLEIIKEKAQEFKLSNGLKVIAYHHLDANQFYASYTTKIGSNDLLLSNDTKMPLGSAHFLEHMMFATKDGDAFEEFSNLGASSNASTSYNRTNYYFTTANNFLENLALLIKMVQVPYFTEEGVAKEKGIVKNEIIMYDQIPFWKLRNYRYQELCVNTNYKNDIAGTCEEVDSITPSILDQIYHDYYYPENQLLVITGNLENINLQEELEKIQVLTIKDNKEKTNKKNIEPLEIKNGFKEFNFDKVENPLSYLTFKVETKEDILITYLSLNVIKTIIFSRLNLNYAQAMDDNIINALLETEIGFEQDLNYISFLIQGDNLKAGKEFLEQEFKNMKISQEDINLGLKKNLGQSFFTYNDPIKVAKVIESIQLREIDYQEVFKLPTKELQEKITQRISEISQNYKKSYIILKK